MGTLPDDTDVRLQITTILLNQLLVSVVACNFIFFSIELHFSFLLSIFLFVKAIVTQEDGMESIAHRFLSAAVKVRFFFYVFFISCTK